MACGNWCQQVDGVAMGSAMAVILANLWLGQFEKQFLLEVAPASPEKEAKNVSFLKKLCMGVPIPMLTTLSGLHVLTICLVSLTTRTNCTPT